MLRLASLSDPGWVGIAQRQVSCIVRRQEGNFETKVYQEGTAKRESRWRWSSIEASGLLDGLSDRRKTRPRTEGYLPLELSRLSRLLRTVEGPMIGLASLSTNERLPTTAFQVVRAEVRTGSGAEGGDLKGRIVLGLSESFGRSLCARLILGRVLYTTSDPPILTPVGAVEEQRSPNWVVGQGDASRGSRLRESAEPSTKASLASA